MSPAVNPPPPGTRWRVTITEIFPDGGQDTFAEFTGEAYIVATAHLSGTRITADSDHDGPLLLRQRLAAYIATSIHDASEC